MDIKWIGSHPNNFGVGRNGKTINKVVLHWIVGKLSAADVTFANPDRKATAHYGIEGTTIHQYVKEEDTAWHASNLTVNRESIGIEHSGGELQSDGTRRKPSDATHQTSAELVASVCARYNIPIDHDHILPHNTYSATQCPGTLDIDRIINLARQIDKPIIEDDNRQLVTDILLALKRTTNEDEINAWLERFENPKNMIEELMLNDGTVQNIWVKPAVEMAKADCEANWQSQLESANVRITKLEGDLEECRTQKHEDVEAISLIKEGIKKLLRITH